MTEPQHQQQEFNGGLTFTQKIGMVAGSVSALYLLPSGANAAIVYVNTNPLSVSLGSGSDVLWDVDNDGNNDFRLWNVLGSATVILLDSNGLNGQGLVKLSGDGNAIVRELPTNFNIGPTLAAGYVFGPNGQSNRSVLTSGGNIGYPFEQGGFTAPGTGYFGFRFLSGGNTYYGWAKIDIGQTTAGTVTITQWAYNDTPNDPIHVTVVPEPTSSLALLAFGAAGVYRWRKGKGNQAQDDEQNEDRTA